MAAFDPINHLCEVANRARGLVANDLKAIPEDKANECPGGCARTPIRFVAECGLFNGMMANYLTTGVWPKRTPEEREAAMSAFDSIESVLKCLNENTDKYIEAIKQVDPNTLGDQPLGFPMTKFAMIELPASHMNYHDGQLNYVQALLGDSEMHW